MKRPVMLKMFNQPAVPVVMGTAAYGPNGNLFFYHQGQIVGRLAGDPADLANELQRAAEKLTPRTVAEVETLNQHIDPRTLTPAQVIAYFEQSPDLCSMAADVRAVLEKLDLPGEPVDQLAQDVAACRFHAPKILNYDGTVQYGAQTLVAKTLGITNAGSYRQRITAVIEALQRENTSTTTPPHRAELSQAA